MSEIILNKDIFAVTGTGDMNTISGLQENTLGRLFSANTLNKLIQAEAFNASTAYTATEFLRDMKTGIWSELPARKTTDIFRRNLQKIYVERLIALINPPASPSGAAVQSLRGQSPTMSKTNDALSIVKGHARSLAAEIKAALPAVQHQATKLHLQDVHERLTQALDPK